MDCSRVELIKYNFIIAFNSLFHTPKIIPKNRKEENKLLACEFFRYNIRYYS